MRAKGNGDISVTVNNLLAITRGEVQYDRLRGVGTEPIDKPAGEAIPEMEQDALWVLETYEPRAEVEEIHAVQDDLGEFTLTAETR